MIDTFKDIQRKHLGLMRQSMHTKNVENTGQIKKLILEISESGKGLEAEDERSTAQSLLDYWNAVLVPLSKGGVKDSVPTELMAFAGSQDGDRPAGENPFRISRPLSDPAMFFDREEAVRSIVRIIAQHSIVFLSGQIGSGRSSLIRAGVLPRLQKETPSRRIVTVSLDERDPVRSLYRVIWGPAGATLPPEEFGKRISEGFGELQMVLIVDNAEDIFTKCADSEARVAFSTALASLAREPHRHSIVLIVREEWLGELRALGEFRSYDSESARYSLSPPTAAELRIILQGSVHSAGLRIDADCLNELTRELQGDPASLSLARFMMLHLWSLSKGGFIGWEAYKQLGSPYSALASVAENVFMNLSEDGQIAAQRLFQSLLKPGLGPFVSCERKSRSALNEHGGDHGMSEVLDAFLKAGVIREESSVDDDDSVTVIHGGIAQRWKRLFGWLEKLRYDSQRRGRVFATAQLWQRSGRQSRYLFRDQASIDEARDYVDATPESQVVRDFINTSSTSLDRSRRITMLATVGISVMLLSILVWIVWHHWYQKELIAGHVQRFKDLSRQDDLKKPPDKSRVLLERQRLASINRLRKYGTAQVDLSNTKLHDLNNELSLDDIDFSNTRFFTSVISNVNFNAKTNTSRDLSQIPFDDSVIINSSFEASNLSFSEFSQARISGTSFVNANLFRTSFNRSQLCNVDFTGANLRSAEFWNSFLNKGTLISASSTAWWLASGWNTAQRHSLLAAPPIDLALSPTFLSERNEREQIFLNAPSSDFQARANALNNLAWLLAINKVDLAPKPSGGDTVSRPSAGGSKCGQNTSIPRTAKAAVTEALCVIDTADRSESMDLRSRLEDTLGYIVFQTDGAGAAVPLLTSAFKNGDKAQQREILFRLSVAKNAINDPGALEDMRKSVVELGYVPTHELLTLREYLAMNNFITALDDALQTVYPEPKLDTHRDQQGVGSGTEDCGLSGLGSSKQNLNKHAQ